MLSRNFPGGAHRGAADEGAKVVIARRVHHRGAENRIGHQTKKGPAHFLRADISQEEQTRAIADETVRVFGKGGHSSEQCGRMCAEGHRRTIVNLASISN